MREILFRGKRTDDGEWMYGNLTVWRDGSASIDEVPSGTSPLHAVDPETVGQYTGLTGTDKNGKKIFEGDIVKWDGEEISNIRYCDGVYRLCNAKGYYGVSLHNHFSYVEVIGNIHDNPELIKESEEEK